MKRRIGLILFAVVGLLESWTNLVLYLTFLDLLLGPADWQMPFWTKYCDIFLKPDYLNDLKAQHEATVKSLK